MVKVTFTPALKRFIPDLDCISVNGSTIAEVLEETGKAYPGLVDYLVEENGALRKHVNIFINGLKIRDRKKLTDHVSRHDEVFILQALSGG